MFPKDDYFKCERHCILVATGEPVTRSMLVSLPVVKEGKFISGQFITLDATFLRVAKMFGPVISWNSILSFSLVIAFYLY